MCGLNVVCTIPLSRLEAFTPLILILSLPSYPTALCHSNFWWLLLAKRKREKKWRQQFVCFATDEIMRKKHQFCKHYIRSRNLLHSSPDLSPTLAVAIARFSTNSVTWLNILPQRWQKNMGKQSLVQYVFKTSLKFHFSICFIVLQKEVLVNK